MGVACPIGRDAGELTTALRSSHSGVRRMPEWDVIADMKGRLGAVVTGIDLEMTIPAVCRRTMGRVSLLAARATREALTRAALGSSALGGGRAGVAYGSTSSSGESLADFCSRLLVEHTTRGIDPDAWLRFAPHSTAGGLARVFGLSGRIVPVSSACASGAQAVGLGFETIRAGLQDVMVCGGAEEMHSATAAVFDVLMATSAGYNARPSQSPRPFDLRRDGLVVGEGAATLVLESEAHARSRGAGVLAEILGFGTNCDGKHLTAPEREGMRDAMKLALNNARLEPARIDYVNAHATGTELGDIEESHATWSLFQRAVPISSIKGATGHTLAACGAIEAVACIAMLEQGFMAGTRNLDEVDPRCAPLGYVREPRDATLEVVMSNNFAFGGINSSLVIGRAVSAR
ncbi:MAG: beta-ketoacyl-ACP synthase [Sandaracinaceae bacterium]|nr:beta-ketoacyl-ACP synthase [Sandaracinaceae bacterium]